MATTVYVLFHETNTGTGEESDGYVEAVYATNEAAETARLAAIRTARDEGKQIWWDPDQRDDQDQPTDWSDDWTVTPYEVLS